MIDLKKARAHLHADLGYKPLNKTWAKIEVFFGLWANALGIMFMLVWSRGFDTIDGYWTLAVAGLLLFVLGGYLTLAGHRSHLYQSSNDLAAYLLEQIRLFKEKD